jgi:hypothetical protein
MTASRFSAFAANGCFQYLPVTGWGRGPAPGVFGQQTFESTILKFNDHRPPVAAVAEEQTFMTMWLTAYSESFPNV